MSSVITVSVVKMELRVGEPRADSVLLRLNAFGTGGSVLEEGPARLPFALFEALRRSPFRGLGFWRRNMPSDAERLIPTAGTIGRGGSSSPGLSSQLLCCSDFAGGMPPCRSICVAAIFQFQNRPCPTASREV